MASHLLSIGVNRSTDREVTPLHYAEEDARRIHEFFRDELGYGDRAHILHGPTHRDVDAALKEIGRQVSAGDTFVLYFSGHGYVVRDDYVLLLSEANITRLERGYTTANDLLSLGLVRDEIAHTWPRGIQVAYIFDACRSPVRAHGKGGAASSQQLQQRLQGLAARGDFGMYVEQGASKSVPDIVMYGCMEGSQSWELEDIQRGCFSFVLQEWMRGGLRRNEPLVLTPTLDEPFADALVELGRQHRKALPHQRPMFEPGSQPVMLWKPTAPPAAPPPSRHETLLKRFTEHLDSGALHAPFGACARDVLVQLAANGLPLEQQQSLQNQLQAAEQAQRAATDQALDMEQVQRAESIGTREAWTTVALLAKLATTRQLAKSRLDDLNLRADRPQEEAKAARQRKEAEVEPVKVPAPLPKAQEAKPVPVVAPAPSKVVEPVRPLPSTPDLDQTQPKPASAIKPATFITRAVVLATLGVGVGWLSHKKEEVAPAQPNTTSQASVDDAAANAATQPEPQIPPNLGPAYRAARVRLIQSPWWSLEVIQTPGKAPPDLAPVLEQAQAAALIGIPEARLDLGQALAYGRGQPEDPARATALLLDWMANPTPRNPEGITRATEALDVALSQAVRRKTAGDWNTLITTAAALPPAWPHDYWQGLMQRCLAQPLNPAGARAAFERIANVPVAQGEADTYQRLARWHLACMNRGFSCSDTCTE